MQTFLLCIGSLYSYLSMLLCIFSTNLPCRHLLLPHGGPWMSPFYHTGGISIFLILKHLTFVLGSVNHFVHFMGVFSIWESSAFPLLPSYTHTKKTPTKTNISTHLIVHRDLHIEHTGLLQWTVRLFSTSLS